MEENIPVMLKKTPRYLRLTEYEFKSICELAEASGMSFAHYMRMVAVREIKRATRLKESQTKTTEE